MFRVIRLCVVPSLLAVVLAGCSANDFAPPITAFSDATKVAATNFKSSRESVEKFAHDRRLKLVDDGGGIGPMDKECRPRAERCRLMVTDKSGRKQPLNTSLDNLQQLMDGLLAYTNSLADIAKADTAGEVARGTQAIKTNLGALLQDSEALAKKHNVKDVDFSKVKPLLGPVADAVSYGLGKVLEAQKVAALREATTEMEAIFPDLIKVFNAVNIAAIQIQRDQIDAAFRTARQQYQRNRNAANRDAYIRAAEAYDAALSSNPKNVFDALREAHGMLHKALTAPEPSFAELWTLLQRATEEANKLAEINKAFQKARAGGEGQT